MSPVAVVIVMLGMATVGEDVLVGTGVSVAVDVGVGIGVRVAVDVGVGIGVSVDVGVKVDPNNCPGAQAENNRLKIAIKPNTLVLCLIFIFILRYCGRPRRLLKSEPHNF